MLDKIGLTKSKKNVLETLRYQQNVITAIQ